MTFNDIDLSIIAPSFVGGLLVLATHVPFGREVLKRGIIFIDLAIAQIAGLGVIAAYRMGWDPHGWEVQITAVSSALMAAFVLSWLEKHYRDIQEALIGISFILAATASILLLADNPHGGESLKEILVGQILWVTWDQLIPTAILAALILIALFGFKDRLKHSGFYFLFAIAVTNSVQLVGVYLVFASLIIPALSSFKQSKPLLMGYIIGGLGYAMGLVLSSVLDLPSGAAIVWSIATIAFGMKFVLVNNLANHT